MTDYFALLGVERRPWMDDEELKAKFHTLTLQHHPDATGADEETRGFAQMNEAYQTLRDPRRRLQHLLAWDKVTSGKSNQIPPVVQDLFSRVSEAMQAAEAVLMKAGATSNALTRGLLQPELLRSRGSVGELILALAQLDDEAHIQLRLLDEQWPNRTAETVAAAEVLQLTFGYVNRWKAQLEEKQFQLAQI